MPSHAVALAEPTDPPDLLQETLMIARPEAFARRLVHVAHQLTAAMESLDDLDLRPFEADNEGERAYQVWEAVAPVVGQTQQTIHALLEAIDGLAAEDRSGLTAVSAIALNRLIVGREELGEHSRSFSEGIRRPELMADRWSVLAHVAVFRGRARGALGETIYEVARTFAPVARLDVVPFFERDTDIAVALRTSLSKLRADVGDLLEYDPDDSLRAKLAKHLEAFAAAEPYRHMRVADRREVVRLRAKLNCDTHEPALRGALERFYNHLSAMAINARETLIQHDDRAVESALGHLQSARECIRTGLMRARVDLQIALRITGRLRGKSSEVDALLRKMGTPPTGSELEVLHTQLETLHKALALMTEPKPAR